MKVRRIKWDSYPKEDYQHILCSVAIGEIIDSLPYAVPENLYSYKIPLPNYWNYKPEIPTMYILEFERTKVYSRNSKTVIRAFKRTR